MCWFADWVTLLSARCKYMMRAWHVSQMRERERQRERETDRERQRECGPVLGLLTLEDGTENLNHNVSNYQSALCNIPEERGSQICWKLWEECWITIKKIAGRTGWSGDASKLYSGDDWFASRLGNWSSWDFPLFKPSSITVTRRYVAA